VTNEHREGGYNVLMRVARRFLVSGRVQGVGYRFFAADAARREGLAGSVRNLDDGRVEAVAEGEAEALERFERALRRGPSRSRVEHVMVDEVTPQMLGTGFDIR
jgi:acylphosphatase